MLVEAALFTGCRGVERRQVARGGTRLIQVQRVAVGEGQTPCGGVDGGHLHQRVERPLLIIIS